MGIRKTIRDVLLLSDDFDKHEEIFTVAAKKLIWNLYASRSSFKQNGGWVKSIDQKDCYYVHVEQPNLLFKTYYLNVKTQEIFLGKGGCQGVVSEGVHFLFKVGKTVNEMPLMRPVPILTKGLPWYKGSWKWLVSTRKWEVVEDYWFFCESLNVWVMIPSGFIFDGASIPKILRMLYSPVGILLLPGLFHDYGYRFENLLVSSTRDGQVNANYDWWTRSQWDKLFLNIGIQVNGFKILNKLPRFGLFVGGGPTWRKHRKNNLSDPRGFPVWVPDGLEENEGRE